MRKRGPVTKETPRIVAMVPAKLGSTRLPMKNLALLGGKPLIYYPVNAARKSGVFDRIVINAEDALFSRIAGRYGVDFYKRPDSLVRQDAKTDEVVYDFLKKNPCDMLAWVSPIAPFQTPQEVRGIVKYFLKEDCDSLMTVKKEQVHCVYKGKSVNFIADEIFAQTQDLEGVYAFVYSVMMWRSRPFIKSFEEKGHALLCGKLGFYPVSKASSIIVKRDEDLLLAKAYLNAMNNEGLRRIEYDRIVAAKKRKGRS